MENRNMMTKNERLKLEIFAANIRKTALRQIASAGKGHVGGSMSISDTMAVLYGKEMRYCAENPHDEGRDRLVMSKGHSGCSLYAALQLKGFFPSEWNKTLNKLGTRLPSHCDRTKTPGIDMSTGSLGQGLSAACGIAWANELKGRDVYTYCIMGDGECQEGQVWEALMFAGFHKQKRLIAFVDGNKKQVDGLVQEILPTRDIGEHARLFGWYVQMVDGHDIGQIAEAVENAKMQDEKPSLICLDTVKGKDCSFAEHLAFNHGIGVSEEQLLEAEAYLDQKISALEQELLETGESTSLKGEV